MLDPIKSDVLLPLAGIKHGFFTRQSGVSQDPLYKSLNCGLGSQDKADNVRQNRKLIIDYFTPSPHEQAILCSPILCSPRQIHSNICHVITTMQEAESVCASSPSCDALVTNQPNIILGVLGADCTPILAYDDKAKIIGAAHAGWKGAFSGIIASLIDNMTQLGANHQDINIAIGPAINQESYEVDQLFYQKFIDDDAGNMDLFIVSNRQDHYLFDLKGYCAKQASKFKLNNISVSPLDTYQNIDLFYSYRRATHLQERDYGRQLSAIMMV